MRDQEGAGSRRTLVLVGGICILLALAAIAVPDGLSLFRENRSEKVLVPATPVFARYLVVALIALSVIVYLVLQVSYAAERKQRTEEYRKPAWPVALGLVLLLTFWVMSPGFQEAVGDLLDRSDRTEQSGDPSQDERGVATEREESRLLGLGVTGILLALVITTAAALRVLVTPERSSERLEREDAFARALDSGIDDLRQTTDPRAAVIACYGGMLAFAAAAGFERERSDTPSESLARLFAAVEVDRAKASRLTALFERARFSHHEVDEAMRDEALELLEGIRSSLAVIS